MYRIWTLTTDGPTDPLTLVGHRGAITAIAFDPIEGRRLITAGRDATARVWDLRPDFPGALPIVLGMPGGVAKSVWPGPVAIQHGWIVIEAGRHVELHRGTDALIKPARGAAGRNLSPSEWKLFFPNRASRPTFPDLPTPGTDEQDPGTTQTPDPAGR